MARLSIVGAALVLFAAGCGGGGGGGGDVAQLSGTYEYAFCSGVFVAPFGGTDWGTVVGHGNGDVTVGSNWNLDGDVGDAAPQVVASTVGADRRWAFLGSDGQPRWAGGLSADGGVGTLYRPQADDSPTAGLIIRPSGLYDMAALASYFHIVRWSWAPGGEVLSSAAGVAELEDSGLWSAAGVAERNGALGSWSSGGSWTVSASGRTVLSEGLSSHVGGMAPGGELFVVGGGTSDGDDPTMIAGVRFSTGMTDAHFAGTYHAVVLGHGAAGTVVWWGTLTTTGVGTWTAHMEGRLDHTPLPAVDSAGTYSVPPDGTFAITLGSGARVNGGLSQSGNFAVLGGPTNMDAGAQIWALVRR